MTIQLLLNSVFWLGSFGWFIYGCVVHSPFHSSVGAAVWLLYPLLLELIFTIASTVTPQAQTDSQRAESRLYYCQGYNITFCGLEKLHPFDSQKYRRVVDALLRDGVVEGRMITQPDFPAYAVLLDNLSCAYRLKLYYSWWLTCFLEMPFLILLPSFLIHWRVLNPMLLALQGTIAATKAAVSKGWAINLAGGYHHASARQGGGFCVYPDISAAVRVLRSELRLRRVMIVDLDVHQGNGHERDFLADGDVFIVDFFNSWIYPNDTTAMQAVGYSQHVGPQTTDEEYLQWVESVGAKIDEFRPQAIVYNAGTDILQGDPLGGVNLTAECIVRRDEAVFRMARDRKLPIVMLLSGGYQMSNAAIIAASITNLISKFGES